MRQLRIENHPLLRREKKTIVTFTFNGKVLQGYEGEPIAAALLANGIRILRKHEETGSVRGLYCAIGHCMECRVQLRDKGQVRACLTSIEEGMEIWEGKQLANEIMGREAP